ncbi:MAG TPA: enoyl-CoA hydratase/isomerase family protein [Acidimicrobiales bacterium]|jgi:enoyl-CoA hydratase/carnithine racemase|nr:enoyl-CoA hydratase/isomerase family protein [Acidimicrobiales bacterium]
MSNSYTTIRYQRNGDVGTLTLARPAKRNAQNPLMWEELAQLGTELLADETLRCLVVMGEGPTFSAGLDLVEGMAGLLSDAAERAGDAELRAVGRTAAQAFSWIPKLGCPSVAGVRGHAYGAGLQLALACDFRVLAQGTKVCLVEMRFGILPDMGATVRLPRIVGESRARELILLGDAIDAAEALRIGLANRVVADAELDAATAELAGRLAAQPPIAVRGARQAIDMASYRSPEDGLTFALEEQLRCLRSEDFAEARKAIADGRSPQWRGR